MQNLANKYLIFCSCTRLFQQWKISCNCRSDSYYLLHVYSSGLLLGWQDKLTGLFLTIKDKVHAPTLSTFRLDFLKMILKTTTIYTSFRESNSNNTHLFQNNKTEILNGPVFLSYTC